MDRISNEVKIKYGSKLKGKIAKKSREKKAMEEKKTGDFISK